MCVCGCVGVPVCVVCVWRGMGVRVCLCLGVGVGRYVCGFGWVCVGGVWVGGCGRDTYNIFILA